MKLVIVESPAKAKSIQKYLGKGYLVKSSKGHIADLPKSQLGVDVDKDFEPEYVVSKPVVLKELKQAWKKADTLVLAVDPDREGEAIGWHVAQQLGAIGSSGRLKNAKKEVERITFTQITEEAVREAAKHPREIDMNLVNAQQARRVLDRLVGYKLSPLLWKKIRYGLSAGRVQSVTVRLIVDREREREAFGTEEYWKLRTYLAQDKSKSKVEVVIDLKPEDGEELQVTKKDIQERLGKKGIEFDVVKYRGKELNIEEEKIARNHVKALEDITFEIKSVEDKLVKKRPPTPFSTSTLQQDSAGKLGFSAKQTMQFAQKLYEAGHISYMRTDSISLAGNTIGAIRKQITSAFGDKYLPEKPNLYKTKSKVAQEAHEAIHPTNIAKSGSALKLTGQELKLYELIRSRTMATQMNPAEFDSRKIVAIGGDYEVSTTGRVTKFQGYLEVYSEQTSERELPKWDRGDQLHVHALFGSQHFTQPPARYTEASLVKELEKLGIGRPSTYAPIIHTIQARKYVDKDGRYFFPTDTGKVVTDLLVKHFTDIVDVGFTANMEDSLDNIANGDENWVKMLANFYKPFMKNLQGKEKSIDRDDFTVLGKSDEKCPECGGKMIIKLGKYGRFLSCTKFPECKGMLSLDESGEAKGTPEEIVKSKEFTQNYLPAPQTEDGKDYVLKQGRFGEFWAHPDYPKVKDAKPLELRPEKIEEMFGKPPETKEGKSYLLKKGKFGHFWAHPDYPKVKDIISIKKSKKEESKK